MKSGRRGATLPFIDFSPLPPGPRQFPGVPGLFRMKTRTKNPKNHDNTRFSKENIGKLYILRTTSQATGRILLYMIFQRRYEGYDYKYREKEHKNQLAGSSFPAHQGRGRTGRGASTQASL
jgi:hypothetical protein